MVENPDEFGTCDTRAAVRLLLLDGVDKLKALARVGWFKAQEPDRWRIADLVQGRIRALLETAALYNVNQMAHALGLSRQRINALTTEGIIKTVAKGHYDRDIATRDYCIHMRKQNTQADRGTSESRVREARATEIEVRTAERTRKLIPLDDAKESNALVCGLVRTEFGGLAPRITRDIELRRAIEKAVNESLARIAARLVKEADALAAGRIVDDAVDDDDTGRMGEAESKLSAVGGDPGPA